MNKKCGIWVLVLLMSFVILPSAAWPQMVTSTVRGVVRDQTQASVPAANVTLTNTATNVARTTQTNEAGIYLLPGVSAGQYHLTVQSAGMQKFEGQLTVRSAVDATVDVVLQVATAATSVEVRDVTPLLVSESASLTTNLERERIEALPIMGRGYQNLIQTAPGVLFSYHGFQTAGRVMGYGLQTGSTLMTMDGVSMTEEHEGWDVARMPDLDAVQELHVEVNGASAKYARPTTVVMSSRSGTNEIHGSLFETIRNSAIGFARRRQDTWSKAPYVNRNEFGGSFGGPIYIPKVYDGRNRTFFFYSYEGARSRIASAASITVPTAAMKAGDFTGLLDSQGRLQKLYDPMTTNATTWERQPLSYNNVVNTVDPARISKPASFLFGITKNPTLPQVNPLLDINFIGAAMRPLTTESHSIRIDHRVSDRDLVYGRFGLGRHLEESGTNYARFEALEGFHPMGGYARRWPNEHVSGTWMRTFSASLTNEISSTYTQDLHEGGSGWWKGWNWDWAAEMGLPNPFKGPNWPTIGNILSNSTNTYQADNQFHPGQRFSRYVTFQDNATWLRGKHELSFGYQFKRYFNPLNYLASAGSFSPDTGATSLYDPATGTVNPGATAQTGANIGNFYLGVMNYSATFYRSRTDLLRHEHALYLQDNWKVTPRLTLNLGMRYEVWTPLVDAKGLMLGFDFDKRAYVLGDTLDNFLKKGATLPSLITGLQNFGGKVISYKDAGVPQSMVNTNWTDFAPRAGFAYRALDGKKAFVVRGGFRVSRYPGTIQTVSEAIRNPQIVQNSFSNSVTNTALSPDGLQNYGLRSVPQYIAGKNTPDSIININETRLLTRGGFGAYRLDPNLPNPVVYDWNFTLEKELLADTVLRVGYMGNNTRNVPLNVPMNSSMATYVWYMTQRTTTPTGEYANVARRSYDQTVYGDITSVEAIGFSWFNGINAGIERRFSKGYAYQFFYDMGNAFEAVDSPSAVNQYMPGTVPTDAAERVRKLNYRRENSVPTGSGGVGAPKHRVRWNWLADVPIGRGKKLGGNMSSLADKFLGGWQVAGIGYLVSRYWNMPTDIYPITGNPIEFYKYQYPIKDCRSGTCWPGYLWWNGYISPHQINSYDANGKPNGVMGVPSNYKPAGNYLIPYGQTALPANAPSNTNMSSYWNTNTVWIPMSNGTVQRTSYDPGVHPWRNQVMEGPMQWFQDASLFKFVNITEKVKLRLNVDFFNILNHPNNPAGIASTGIMAVQNSDNDARMTQLSLRLTW